MIFWIKLKIHLNVLKTFLLLILTYFSKNDLKKKYYFQRLGVYGKKKFKGKSIVIFSNAGEISGTDAFLSKLKQTYPSYSLIVAVETFDAMHIAKNSIKSADEFMYFTHDLNHTIKKFLKYADPAMILFLYALFRSEIINQCNKLGIKTGIINGYFRDQLLEKKGAEECLSLMQQKNIFDKLDFCAMQTEEDCKKISEFMKDKSKVHLSGFLKFDLNYANVTEDAKEQIKREYFISKDDVILIAGATNFDEDVILNSYLKIASQINSLKLIIVPRRTERINDIEQLIVSMDLSCLKKSELSQTKNKYGVLLVDTEINLAKLYSIGDVNILGRSFVPFEKVKQGGSNIFEAAVHGKPVFFGTNMSSWKEYSSKILGKFPDLEAKDADELAEKIISVLKNKKEYLRIGRFMKQFVQKELVEKQKKVIDNYMKIINKYV